MFGLLYKYFRDFKLHNVIQIQVLFSSCGISVHPLLGLIIINNNNSLFIIIFFLKKKKNDLINLSSDKHLAFTVRSQLFHFLQQSLCVQMSSHSSGIIITDLSFMTI